MKLFGGGGGNRTRVRKQCRKDLYMLSRCTIISRKEQSSDRPLYSPASFSFTLRSKTVRRTIQLLRRFFPHERAHQRETGCLIIRQPLHSYSLQLNFCPTFLRGWSEPRHAVQVTPIPVETMSPPVDGSQQTSEKYNIQHGKELFCKSTPDAEWNIFLLIISA